MDSATGDYAFAYSGVLQPSSIEDGLYLTEDQPAAQCRRRAHAFDCRCLQCIEMREYSEFRMFKASRARYGGLLGAPPPYRAPTSFRETLQTAPTPVVQPVAPATRPMAPAMQDAAVATHTGCSSCSCDSAMIKLVLLFIVIAIAAMAMAAAMAPEPRVLQARASTAVNTQASTT